MNFESFAGNPEAKAQLSAAVDGGHFPHALLLEGPAGSGKRMLAALLAKAAVCVAPAGEKPCGACSGCLKAAAGAHPDIRTEGGDGAAGPSTSTRCGSCGTAPMCCPTRHPGG